MDTSYLLTFGFLGQFDWLGGSLTRTSYGRWLSKLVRSDTGTLAVRMSEPVSIHGTDGETYDGSFHGLTLAMRLVSRSM